MADVLTREQRVRCMRANKGADTSIERQLRSALFRHGLRFRKNYRRLPGSPDVVFTKQRLVVFVDGDFWHGFEFDKWCHKLSPFWKKKIADNIERDRTTSRVLREEGWRVLRYWEHEVRQRENDVTRDILAAVEKQKC